MEIPFIVLAGAQPSLPDLLRRIFRIAPSRTGNVDENQRAKRCGAGRRDRRATKEKRTLENRRSSARKIPFAQKDGRKSAKG
jgi:hypothetical protein